MQKICLIVCYFGQWPRWFGLFLETCKRNPDVGWLFFTDCPIPATHADHLRFVPGNMADFNALASAKLSLPIQVSIPYKICDYRPAFGLIFRDYLKPYAFWGHTDLDVIYGDIRHFITEALLDRHDVITARKAYLCGHFTLYRNEARINHLFEQSPDWPFVFQDPTYRNFDECNFMWQYLRKHGTVFDQKPAIDSMTHVVKRLREAGRLRAAFKPLVRERFDLKTQFWKVRWHDGKMVDVLGREEFMYFHLNILKKEPGFHIPDWSILPDLFFLTNEWFTFPSPPTQPSTAA